MGDRILIEFQNIEQAAIHLRVLRGSINSRTFDIDMKRTTGAAQSQIDALASTLKEVQQSLLELVTNSQELLVYLSDTFKGADIEATYIIPIQYIVTDDANSMADAMFLSG